MSFYRAVAKHLTRTGGITGLTFTETAIGGNVFIGSMPSAPDVAVAILPQPGGPQLTSAPTDLPAFQILVRGAVDDFLGPETMAAEIVADLTCLDGVWLDQDGDDEVWLIGMTAAQSTAAHTGLDPNRRHEFYANFTARIHSPTTHRPAGV